MWDRLSAVSEVVKSWFVIFPCSGAEEAIASESFSI
jgi:hypothetical protein